MKKLVVLFLAVSAVTMGSCSKDDNESASLQGTWELIKRVTKSTKNGETTVKEDIADFKNCDGVRAEFTKTQIISTVKEKHNNTCEEKKYIDSYVREGNKITTTNSKGKKYSLDIIKLTNSELVIFYKFSEMTTVSPTTTYEEENTVYYKRVN